VSSQIQRVKRGPKPKIHILPVDNWRETIFVEADGTELIVMCSGKMPGGWLWPEGLDMDKERQPSRVHLARRS